MTPEHCPACRATGVIATKNGPTCQHSEKHGVAWWPAEWGAMQEPARVEWIWANRTKAK